MGPSRPRAAEPGMEALAEAALDAGYTHEQVAAGFEQARQVYTLHVEDGRRWADVPVSAEMLRDPAVQDQIADMVAEEARRAARGPE